MHACCAFHLEHCWCWFYLCHVSTVLYVVSSCFFFCAVVHVELHFCLLCAVCGSASGVIMKRTTPPGGFYPEFDIPA